MREDVFKLLIGDSSVSELFGENGESCLPDREPWNTLLALLIGAIYSNVIKVGSSESYIAKTLKGRAEQLFEPTQYAFLLLPDAQERHFFAH